MCSWLPLTRTKLRCRLTAYSYLRWTWRRKGPAYDRKAAPGFRAPYDRKRVRHIRHQKLTRNSIRHTMTVSFLRTNRASSNTGGRASLGTRRTTFEACGNSRVRPISLNLKKCATTISQSSPADTLAGKIDTDIDHSLAKFLSLCHLVPARPSSPHLQFFDREKDATIR